MEITPTIVLADDNFDDQAFLRDAFDYIGAKVNLKTFDDGLEAIAYLQSAPQYDLPDLIVLDYNMPQMNGVEVLQVLCKEEKLKHVPKVILSTSRFQKFVEGGMSIGADACFIKPDNVFDLKKLAKELLGFIKVEHTKN